MKWRSTATVHKSKTSIGIGGKFTTTGGLTKDLTSGTTNLTNTRAPKYTASILFLEVTAYTLGQSRISRLSDGGKRDAPQRDEDVRRKQEKREQDYFDIVFGKASGGMMSAQNRRGKPWPDLSRSLKKSGQKRAQRSSKCPISELTWDFLGLLI